MTDKMPELMLRYFSKQGTTYGSVNDLFEVISSMVREIGYPVSKFETTGSESSTLDFL